MREAAREKAREHREKVEKERKEEEEESLAKFDEWARDLEEGDVQ